MGLRQLKICEKDTIYAIYCLAAASLSQPVAAWQQGCEEMGREGGNGERVEIERERFLPSPFSLLLSISSFSSHFPLFPLNSSQFTAFLATVAKILGEPNFCVCKSW